VNLFYQTYFIDNTMTWSTTDLIFHIAVWQALKKPPKELFNKQDILL